MRKFKLTEETVWRESTEVHDYKEETDDTETNAETETTEEAK